MKLAVGSFSYIYRLKKTSVANARVRYPHQGLECPSVWQHKGTRECNETCPRCLVQSEEEVKCHGAPDVWLSERMNVGCVSAVH